MTEQDGDSPKRGRPTAPGATATRRRSAAKNAADAPSNSAGSNGAAPTRPQSPFVRLARVHALSSGGDAIVAIALAGSLFFIDPEAARSRLLLYLVLTVAPFALVGPFIGPALDRARGGRQTMIVVINALRVFTAGLIAFYLSSLLLFPIVFVHMVLGKSYAVAKASIVPSTVQSDAELVEKNSRLAVLTAVASAVAAIPAFFGQLIGGSLVTTLLAAFAYLLAAVAATRLAKSDPVASTSGEAAVTTGNVFLASTGMAVMRGIGGFMFFLLAFKFGGRADELELSGVGRAVGASIRVSMLGIEGEGRSLWKLGVLFACSGAGSFIGSFLAPQLRERFAEGKLLLGGLSATAVVSLLATWVGGLSGAGVLAFVVGFSIAVCKLAFDAIVQRDAVGANLGALFARFETRFQLAWAVGALFPVIFQINFRIGAFVMAAAAAFAAASYYFGGRSALAGTVSPISATALRGRLQKRNVDPATDVPVEAAGDVAPAVDSDAVEPPPPLGRRSRRGRRAKRSRSAGSSIDAASAAEDELEVPAWIGGTPAELQSIRPAPKPQPDTPHGTPEMWDDHR